MSIGFLHFFLLFLATAFAVIGIQVQLINRESKINRLFLITCMSLSLWALGYAFMISGVTLQHANGWRIVAALGWNTFYVHWLTFVMRLTGTKKMPTKPLMALLYVPTVVFFMRSAFADPAIVLTKTTAGWLDVGYTDIAEYSFTFFYLSIMFYSLVLLNRWRLKGAFIRERKQAAIIQRAVIIALVLGAGTDSLMPMIGVTIFPLGIFFIAGSMLAIWYAIAKYKLMTLKSYYLSEHVLRAVRLPILIVDDHNLVKRCNETACRLFGMEETNFLGKDIEPLIHSANGDLHGVEGQLNRSGDEVDIENIEGTKVRCMMTLTVLRDEFGDVLGKSLILSDISNNKEAEAIIGDYNKYLMKAVDKRTQALALFNERLKVEAEERKYIEEQISNLLYYDELTHLPNRLYFKEQLAEILQQYAVEKNKVLAILFLDLDDFKYINDSLGHYVGDELLKKVAVRLKELLWGHYLVAHSGGDEFLILIHNMESDKALATVEKLTGEIIEGFNRPFHVVGKELFVTTSMGTSFFPKDGHDFDNLVRHADMALFEAKLSGKNIAILSTGEMMSRIDRIVTLRNSLYRALDQHELTLYYQPQIDTQTHKIIGMEALLRWKLSDGTFVSPSEFIPLAEETGLIVPIGEWVIEQAGKKITSLHEMGYTHLVMAVNVSVNQIKQIDFVDRVRHLLEKTGVQAGQMEFEITERVGLQELLEAERVIDHIHQLGISVSIDDFGTDYSSFMTVKRLQIDKIKIAMEFVQGVGIHKKDEAIVRTITRLGSILDMHVIAEGVENLEQLKFVEKIQCNSVQGYYFYRPMTSEQLDATLLSEVETNSGERQVNDVTV